jgi:hypothetical protein
LIIQGNNKNDLRSQDAHNVDYSKLEIENIQDATKDDIQGIVNSLNARLKKLQSKEDEFNKNAALVPESDPNVTLINDKIMHIKELVEKQSADR